MALYKKAANPKHETVQVRPNRVPIHAGKVFEKWCCR
jgi:hypothetical protein